MFDTPFYIAEEYLYNNRIYKGRYPISIVEEVKPVSIPLTKEQLLQELAETDLSRLEPEESVNGSKYFVSQTDTTDKKQAKFEKKQMLPVI
jgi:hypothetical protein